MLKASSYTPTTPTKTPESQPSSFVSATGEDLNKLESLRKHEQLNFITENFSNMSLEYHSSSLPTQVNNPHLVIFTQPQILHTAPKKIIAPYINNDKPNNHSPASSPASTSPIPYSSSPIFKMDEDEASEFLPRRKRSISAINLKI